MKIDDILDRWKTAKKNKSAWHNHWDELARVMLPRREGFASTHATGEERTEQIYDGTPMQAARGLANALDGFLWPEGEQSFHVRATEDSVDSAEEAQVWMATAESRMNQALDNPKARFRQARGEVNQDLSVLGTAILFAGESKNLDRLSFQSVHLKDAAVLFDDEGQPTGLFRHKKPTIRQAMARFGKENLSEETRKAIQSEKKLDSKIDVLHAVMLRDEGRPDALFASDLPFTNKFIEVKQKHEISDGGFHEFPFMIPRWDTSSGEDYGRSPGMIALPDSNTLQAMGETLLVAGQRAADPPLMAPNDGSFSEVNAFPGGLGYYDVETAARIGRNPFFPLETGSNMPLTQQMQADVRDQVFRAFFRNILNLPVDGPQMTATEIIERKEEFIREIGPVFGRLEGDYKAPLIERVFNVMLRAGQFPDIPDVLSGQNIEFEYESPISKIRKQIQASAARQWAIEQVEYATVDPSAADLVNFEALGRFNHAALGLPFEVINSEEVVAQRAQQRAEQQQAEALTAELEQGAGIVDTAAAAAQKAGLTETANA